MKEVTQWWSEINGGQETWLLIGKGPTFARKDEFDFGEFKTIGLNHVVQTTELDIVSIIDIDVVVDCGESIERNAQVLLMPRFPHVDSRPTDKSLESFVAEIPVLQRMSDEGRLVWYYYADAPSEPGAPVAALAHFSGEVMVNLLAVLGARKIRTLGIDGGTTYSDDFDTKTLFSGGLNSFDLQWDGIASMVRRHDIEYYPLTTESPIRVFVGTDESQLLGARILEYSIKKHTPIPVVCDTMMDLQVRQPKDPKNETRTQFSFNRFAIPQRAGYQGRALYLDADMLVLRNIQELWDIPFEDARVLLAPSSSPDRPRQFSVMLLNCDKLRWNVDDIIQGMDDGKYDYQRLMFNLCIEQPEAVQDRIPKTWNSLEEYTPGVTGLIHYTDMHIQPWVSRKNPIRFKWVEYLRAAIDDGFVELDEVKEAVDMGFVRPSLLSELRAQPSAWRYMEWWMAPLNDRKFQPHKALAARLHAARKAAQSGKESLSNM